VNACIDTCAAPRQVGAPAVVRVDLHLQPGLARADLASLIGEPDRPIPTTLSRRDRATIHHLRASYQAAFADRALRIPMGNPEAVYEAMRPLLAARPVEAAYLLPLDVRCALMTEPICLTIGDIDGVEVPPRLVLRQALTARAIQMILVHNHPSGNPEPSPADIEVTRRLVGAGRAVDIHLRDHVVISQTGFASIRRIAPSIFA